MVTDDGSRTLCDSRLGETYHSGCGALSECLHVYLRNSGVEGLLCEATLVKPTSDEAHTQRRQTSVRVLEFGFGTGMACLLTLASAVINRCPLAYVALEQQLLPAEILEQLRIGDSVAAAIEAQMLPREYAVVTELERAWLDFRKTLPREPEPGEVTWNVNSDIALSLVLGDAIEYSQRLAANFQPKFDAVYFDAFSPATNPELWTQGVYEKLAGALVQNGLLVSYCVNGAVRRGLESAGFIVTRTPGPPGGKREVLQASIKS